MKLYAKIMGAVFLYDLLLYPLFYFVLWRQTGSAMPWWINLCLRCLGCCGIGLWFACRNRLPAVGKRETRRAVLISAAALLFGVYYLLGSLYIPLWDMFWYGAQTFDLNVFSHPVRLFFSDNLADQPAVFSYTCLLAAFQLGRLRFSTVKASPSYA